MTHGYFFLFFFLKGFLGFQVFYSSGFLGVPFFFFSVVSSVLLVLWFSIGFRGLLLWFSGEFQGFLWLGRWKKGTQPNEVLICWALKNDVKRTDSNNHLCTYRSRNAEKTLQILVNTRQKPGKKTGSLQRPHLTPKKLIQLLTKNPPKYQTSLHGIFALKQIISIY